MKRLCPIAVVSLTSVLGCKMREYNQRDSELLQASSGGSIEKQAFETTWRAIPSFATPFCVNREVGASS